MLAQLLEGWRPPPGLLLALSASRARALEPGWTWSDREREALAARRASARPGMGYATPMHFGLALTDLTGTDPRRLSLSEADSQRLCAACEQHLAAEGIRFQWIAATLWRIETQQPIEAFCERPLFLAGQPIRPLLPRGPDARRLERWMNELQMLLHEHPINRARSADGLAPVNGVWLWGFDGLPAEPSEALRLDFHAALADGDRTAWQGAWSALAETLKPGQRLILGEAQPQLEVSLSAPSLGLRMMGLLRQPDPAALFERWRARAAGQPS
ncbi:MAG: hypothetical protein NZ533_00410 [Casimicrobiaceae bacterium]|nr:hypothetical protein [Casimicrobiaceae bacterium]MDW8311805.1 hypothetical protein [Burkholderiales bacterium]